MKLSRALVLIILLLIQALIFCKSDGIASKEEVIEEVIQKEKISDQNSSPFSVSTLNRVCRKGYRLDSFGNCRKILGTKATTVAP